jgi:predicted enzyme related to lactoylglutathione lyase
MWLVYIATSDAADTVKKAEAAGGNVLGEPMQVGPQGTMAIIQDPSGAVIGVWQPNQIHGSPILGKANAFGWSELNSRGVDKAKPFYRKVFGWGKKKSEMAEGMEYTEFLANGDSIAGGMEMTSMVPAQVPSYWLAYFTVEDVDKVAQDGGRAWREGEAEIEPKIHAGRHRAGPPADSHGRANTPLPIVDVNARTAYPYRSEFGV